jgi:hypothetical protein
MQKSTGNIGIDKLKNIGALSGCQFSKPRDPFLRIFSKPFPPGE